MCVLHFLFYCCGMSVYSLSCVYMRLNVSPVCTTHHMLQLFPDLIYFGYLYNTIVDSFSTNLNNETATLCYEMGSVWYSALYSDASYEIREGHKNTRKQKKNSTDTHSIRRHKRDVENGLTNKNENERESIHDRQYRWETLMMQNKRKTRGKKLNAWQLERLLWLSTRRKNTIHKNVSTLD